MRGAARTAATYFIVARHRRLATPAHVPAAPPRGIKPQMVLALAREGYLKSRD